MPAKSSHTKTWSNAAYKLTWARRERGGGVTNRRSLVRRLTSVLKSCIEVTHSVASVLLPKTTDKHTHPQSIVSIVSTLNPYVPDVEQRSHPPLATHTFIMRTSNQNCLSLEGRMSRYALTATFVASTSATTNTRGGGRGGEGKTKDREKENSFMFDLGQEPCVRSRSVPACVQFSAMMLNVIGRVESMPVNDRYRRLREKLNPTRTTPPYSSTWI